MFKLRCAYLSGRSAFCPVYKIWCHFVSYDSLFLVTTPAGVDRWIYRGRKSYSSVKRMGSCKQRYTIWSVICRMLNTGSRQVIASYSRQNLRCSIFFSLCSVGKQRFGGGTSLCLNLGNIDIHLAASQRTGWINILHFWSHTEFCSSGYWRHITDCIFERAVICRGRYSQESWGSICHKGKWCDNHVPDIVYWPSDSQSLLIACAF